MIDQEEIGSVLQCLDHMDDLSRAQCDKADKARELGRIDLALHHCDMALRSARKDRNSKVEAAVLMHRWAVQISDQSEKRMTSLKAGLQDCAEARKALESVGDSYGVALTITAAGLTHQEQGLEYERQRNHNAAMESFQSAYDEYREAHQKLGEVRRRLHTNSKYEEVDRCQDLTTIVRHKIEDVDDLYVSSSANATRVPRPFHDGFLRFSALPLKGRIAAGVPINTTDDITGYTTVDSITINDIPHAVLVAPARSSEVRLDFAENDYCLTLVDGDSMDKAGVLSGDYVIIRRPRGRSLAPEDGDIVAAVVKGEDRQSTLKRFKRSGNQLTLEPDSHNDKHTPYTETAAKWDKKVEVAGVMVALLVRR